MTRTVFDARVFSGLSVILVGSLIALAISYVETTSQLERQEQAFSASTQSLFLSKELKSDLQRSLALIPLVILEGTPELPERLRAANADFLDHLSAIYRADQASEFSTGDLGLLGSIRETALTQVAGSEKIIAARMSGRAIDAKRIAAAARDDAKLLQSQISSLISKKETGYDAANKQLLRTQDLLSDRLYALTVASVLLVISTLVWLLRSNQQKRLEAGLQRSIIENEKRVSLARKEIVESVAHDLKNPLSAIQMALEVLKEQIQEQCVSSSDLDEAMAIASRAASSMTSLIGDLLDHSKIEAKDVVLDRESNDLISTLEYTLSLHSPVAIQKKIQISLDESSKDLATEFSFDRTRIARVYGNLLGNAIKFTPIGGAIRTHVVWNEETVRVIVEDSGPGLSAEQSAHIFDRFWQVKETAKLGTGLGLAIAKGFIDAHKGKIWVESEVGVGSKFCFLLPIEMEARTLRRELGSTQRKSPNQDLS